MRYYNKKVFPKEAVRDDSEFSSWIKKSIASALTDAIMDNMTFDENDDCINYPEWQDRNGWVTEYIGSVDISIPTKLIPMMPMIPTVGVYVCENCFSNKNVTRSYSFYKPVPKYCECCGAHFTNIFQDSEANDGLYFIEHEEEKE